MVFILRSIKKIVICIVLQLLRIVIGIGGQNDTILRVIGRKMKKIVSILRNKDYVYSDLILSKKDFEEFKEYVNQFWLCIKVRQCDVL